MPAARCYMRNRFYDPATGQFTQTDPIGLAGGLNAYGFAAGDPVSYSDPYGLKVCFEGNSFWGKGPAETANGGCNRCEHHRWSGWMCYSRGALDLASAGCFSGLGGLRRH
jgi:hypothetical protein